MQEKESPAYSHNLRSHCSLVVPSVDFPSTAIDPNFWDPADGGHVNPPPPHTKARRLALALPGLFVVVFQLHEELSSQICVFVD